MAFRRTEIDELLIEGQIAGHMDVSTPTPACHDARRTPRVRGAGPDADAHRPVTKLRVFAALRARTYPECDTRPNGSDHGSTHQAR